MLSALDETLLHQSPQPFDLCDTSDHRFFDRTLVTANAPDGQAGVILGFGLYKNMNVLDGFATVQADRTRQLNLRMSRELRPQLEPILGPLRMEIVEPFREIRYVLEKGDGPFSFDLRFHRFFDAILEDPHFHRMAGRITQDYVRFNQLMTVTGHLEIEGKSIVADRWFGWRDHSWGVRPGVGGFEPPLPNVSDPFPSAARSGGKGLVLFYIGFNIDDEFGGGIQVIEDAAGGRIYAHGQIGAPDRPAPAIVDYEWEVEVFPGTRAPKRVQVKAKTADGQTHDIVAEPTGRPWVYRGLGYDAGYADGKGQGVWRGAGLHVEQDIYDISDPEAVLLPDGSTIRPNHREVAVKVTVNGRTGYGYMPFIAIGDVVKFQAR